MNTSSLKHFLDDGKLSGNILTVTLVKKITNERYIIGDKSGLAILEYSNTGKKELKIGTGIKLIKPVNLNKWTVRCNSNFAPVKTLDHDEVNAKPKQLQELENKVEKPKENSKHDNHMTFEEIRKMPTGNAIQKLTFLVTKNSRIITTTSGQYQICGLKDIQGQTLSINLYDKFINSLEVGNVFMATRIKKFNLKKDGQYESRLSTTKFTGISLAPAKETKLFENMKISDNSMDGTILGFSELNCYYSCSIHWNKIDDTGACPACNDKPPESKFDFKAKLLVACPDNEEEIKTFLMFKRAAKMITTEETEEDVENKLAEYSGGQCTIEYDNSDEELVILRRLVIHK